MADVVISGLEVGTGGIGAPNAGNWQGWHHVFQGRNNVWINEQRTILGNFFLGLQGNTGQVWDTQIPPGSTIKSAFMRLTVWQANLSTFNVHVHTPDRTLHDQLPLVEPFNFFTGWRPGLWDRVDVNVFNNVGGLQDIGTFGLTASAFWPINIGQYIGAPLPQWNQVGNKFTPAATYNIGRMDWTLQRVGTVSGSCRCRIRESITVNGKSEPGASLAVSNEKTVSTISAAGGGTQTIFLFSGVNQIQLDAGTEYFTSIEVDFANGIANTVLVYYASQFLIPGGGTAYVRGTGLSMDYQNYPGVVDVNQAFHLNDFPPPDGSIDWMIPPFPAPGDAIDSPDIASILQTQVDASWYTQDSGIIISMHAQPSAPSSHIYRSGKAIPGPAAQLFVTYEPPADRVNAGDSSRRHKRMRKTGFENLDPRTIQLQQEDEEIVAFLLASADILR